MSYPPVLLLPDHLRRRLDCYLSDRLASLLGEAPLDAGVRDAIHSFAVDPGGKRIRPQMVLWTLQRCGGVIDEPGPAWDAACAWELFHAFLLAHDDIIDAADRRRGRPSLHRALAALDHDSTAFGTGLAIVAGDMLFAAATRLWHEAEADCPAGEARRQFAELLGKVAMLTGAGQAADIAQALVPLDEVDVDAVLAGYHAKTAAYTFEGPMLAGALLAGVTGPTLGRLSTFATRLGQAYQVHNDLLDLRGPPTIGGDLVQGKRTIALLRGRGLTDDAAGFDADLAAATQEEADADARLAAAARLGVRLHDDGGIEAAEQCVETLLAEARDAIVVEVPDDLTRGVLGLLAHLEETYFSLERAAQSHRDEARP
jgi:geranylgeranyl pyrophosphate synthase